MKSLILSLMLVVGMFADSLVITPKVFSKHFVEGDFNENNKGIGIGYQIDHSPSLSSQVDHIEFINSYKAKTKFTGYSINYTPLIHRDFKSGMFASIVYNQGYCGTFERCTKYDNDDTSIVPLLGLITEWQGVSLKVTALPNIQKGEIEAVVGILQIKFNTQ